MFILFYKLDKDGDGYINYSELSNAFIPNQQEYSILIKSRKSFYGSHSDPRFFFKGDTREILKRQLKGLIDSEVSIEVIK